MLWAYLQQQDTGFPLGWGHTAPVWTDVWHPPGHLKGHPPTLFRQLRSLTSLARCSLAVPRADKSDWSVKHLHCRHLKNYVESVITRGLYLLLMSLSVTVKAVQQCYWVWQLPSSSEWCWLGACAGAPRPSHSSQSSLSWAEVAEHIGYFITFL